MFVTHNQSRQNWETHFFSKFALLIFLLFILRKQISNLTSRAEIQVTGNLRENFDKSTATAQWNDTLPQSKYNTSIIAYNTQFCGETNSDYLLVKAFVVFILGLTTKTFLEKRKESYGEYLSG